MKPLTKICINCGNSYDKTGAKYCSLNCYNEYKLKNGWINIPCSHCKKEFRIKEYRYKQKQKIRKNIFCSIKCRTIAQTGIKRPEELLKREICICIKCGKEYKVLPYFKNIRKFCSQKCAKHDLKLKDVNVKCAHCNKDIILTGTLYNNRTRFGLKDMYCSQDCQNKSQVTGINDLIDTICTYCGKSMKRIRRLIEFTDIHFCTRHCQGNYYSKNLGRNERSLLEHKIESYIKRDYPHLNVIYGDREQCYTMELDIFIPTLMLAFEINGPVHYKPIFGEDSLRSIQKKDIIKQKICESKHIDLIIIDDIINYHKDNSELIYNNKIQPKIQETIGKQIHEQSLYSQSLIKAPKTSMAIRHIY